LINQSVDFNALFLQLVKEVALKKKEVDDVLGGEEAWKNVQKSQVTCPNCSNHEAYFREIQTRSADEPATIFYRCTSCAKTWKEG
jgi:DNA-directed RNA polymerase III subunit RPC11